MKTTKIFLMAALALTFAACSNEDNDLTPQQTAEQPADNMITITAQLAPKSGSALTRAVADNDDNKITVTWAVDETLKIISANGHNATATITAVDGTTGAATISFTIDAAAKGQNCTIIYPADAAVTESAGEYTANPITAQDGTLKAALDVRIGKGTITDKTTPTLNVTTQPEAQFAIFKFSTVKDAASTPALNVKPLTITIGEQNFVITPASATSTLYAALPAVSGQAVSFSATGSDSKYTFSKDNVTFAAGKYYATTLTMAKVVHYSSAINVPAGEHWYISGSGTHNITIGNDATVTIDDHLEMQYASIICSGNATIILADGSTTNILDGRIKAGPEGSTLTIKGNTGELNIPAGTSSGAAIGASDGDACGNIVIEGGIITATGVQAAGIGAYNAKCGDITISGGTVTATGSNGAGIGASNAECGDITISGGTVTATGGDTGGAGIGSGSSSGAWCGNITISGGTVEANGGTMAAGIGTGDGNGCGNITIKSTVTSVTATKGSYASVSIGSATGDDEACGTVTIEAGANVTEN